jgi:hypothetical protein
MAKKNKAVKTPAKGTRVRTVFMAAFTEQFIGRLATTPFPAIGRSKTRIAADFITIMSILIAAEVRRKPPPAGNSRSLAGKVGNFLRAQNWPSKSPVAKQWKINQRALHLIEIAVIADRLLEAINLGSGPQGGLGSGWPPH